MAEFEREEKPRSQHSHSTAQHSVKLQKYERWYNSENGYEVKKGSDLHINKFAKAATQRQHPREERCCGWRRANCDGGSLIYGRVAYPFLLGRPRFFFGCLLRKQIMLETKIILSEYDLKRIIACSWLDGRTQPLPPPRHLLQQVDLSLQLCVSDRYSPWSLAQFR